MRTDFKTWQPVIGRDEFLQDCAAVAVNDALFGMFKKMCGIRTACIRNDVNARMYWQRAKWLWPDIVNHMKVLYRCDSVGGGSPVYVEDGVCLEATTAYHAMMAAEMSKLFYGMRRVIEIGGGYGCLAVILSSLWRCEYTIVDLREPLLLQARYTGACDVEVELLSEIAPTPFDLVISHSALSELDHNARYEYGQCLLEHSTCGHLVWGGHHDAESYIPADRLQRDFGRYAEVDLKRWPDCDGLDVSAWPQWLVEHYTAVFEENRHFYWKPE